MDGFAPGFAAGFLLAGLLGLMIASGAYDNAVRRTAQCMSQDSELAATSTAKQVFCASLLNVELRNLHHDQQED